MLLVNSHKLLVCYSYALACTRMYLYVTCMLLICTCMYCYVTRMLPVQYRSEISGLRTRKMHAQLLRKCCMYLYALACTRMLLVCTRMLFVCTCMLLACTRMCLYVTRMVLVCTRTYVTRIYYPTVLRRVQITLKTSTNITRYLYSRGPVRQVSCH